MVAMSSSCLLCRGVVVVAEPRGANVDELRELAERERAFLWNGAGLDADAPRTLAGGVRAERPQAEVPAAHDRKHALDRSGHGVHRELERVLDLAHRTGSSIRSAFAPPGGTIGHTLASRSMRMSRTTGPACLRARSSDGPSSLRRSTRMPSTS